MASAVDILAEASERRKALLVGFARGGESRDLSILDELGELVKNLGIDAVGREVAFLREPSAHFLVGSGKFSEIAQKARSLGADLIVFDDELSPAQQRNWEAQSGLLAINRQEIILDIFASRAQTKEARLQVELAKLEYSLPRLRKAWSHLDRQRGGGITQRGGGESQLELDRRFISERIAKLKAELARVRVMREVQRKRRMRVPVPTAAVVGYTNAGKSSLINALADASLLAQDKLFATLDPATRRMRLANGSEILLTDTVGFVRKLPHKFVEAFKATLEEAVVSDIILHVVDASNPEAFGHIETTMGVLAELGADGKKTITVMNKSDAVSDESHAHALRALRPDAVWTSALRGDGMRELADKIAEAVSETDRKMRLVIPHSEYKSVAELHRLGAVMSQKDTAEGAEIFARVPARLAGSFAKWEDR